VIQSILTQRTPYAETFLRKTTWLPEIGAKTVHWVLQIFWLHHPQITSLVTGSIVLKLAAGRHCRQGVRAVQDFLEKRIVV
jgi:hypothetical protein